MFDSVDQLQEGLRGAAYLAGDELSTAVFLAIKLRRPLFLEGAPGTGKTQLAKAMAQVLDAPLFRLQCYEGIDIAQAAYEWNVPKQMLAIRLAEMPTANLGLDVSSGLEKINLYAKEFLLERALLASLNSSVPSVLLIDELDRADDAFEAYLLEYLAEAQLSIPELGTVHAKSSPLVIITSNRVRQVHDALKRRCLYHWMEYPDYEQELAILRAQLPHLPEKMAQEVTRYVQSVRGLELDRPPGVAETLDWARSIEVLAGLTSSISTINHETVSEKPLSNSLGVLLKTRSDIDLVRNGADNFV